MQGVTTEVSGNCGLSAAPLMGPAAAAREKDFKEYGIERTWDDFEGFFSRLPRRARGEKKSRASFRQ